MRITVQQFANSRAAQSLGLCATNLLGVCSYLNEATERLLNAFSETGPYGCWDKVVFNVDRASPYITLPARYARAVNMDVCRMPVRVQNEWVEVLLDGIGLQSICDGQNGCGVRAAYDRANVPTAFDLPASNQLLRIYPTSASDIGKQIIFSDALDQNGNGIYSAAGLSSIGGFPLVLQSPFTTTSFIVTSFAGIEKPVTAGDVVLKSVDATTGVETFLSRFTPQETNPSYRRYYLHALPAGCCPCPTNPCQAQITAMLKLEYVPTCRATDVLLIGSIPALKEECLAIKYSEQDTAASQQFAILKHRNAVRLLNEQLAHYMGTEMPAINVMPTPVIGLREMRVGSMM